MVELTSRFATRDRAVDLSRPGVSQPLAASDRSYYTAATELMPTDGIVAKTARDVYGIRMAKSEFGYRSLGAGTPNITRAQVFECLAYYEDHRGEIDLLVSRQMQID